MELSPRLRAVADLVAGGAKFADIGTDHGCLPVWLILRGVISSAIASDLREGPLERAKQTAARYGVQTIRFCLSDGLNGVLPEEADTVAIAGMGGDTIANILAAAPWTKLPGKTLLLQPMTAQPDLRGWLGENGYQIAGERVAQEGRRLYSVWTVRGGQMPPLTPGELWAGQQRGDPLRGAYLDDIIGRVRRALEGHMRSARPDKAAIDGLQEVLDQLLEMKGELERGGAAGCGTGDF